MMLLQFCTWLQRRRRQHFDDKCVSICIINWNRTNRKKNMWINWKMWKETRWQAPNSFHSIDAAGMCGRRVPLFFLMMSPPSTSRLNIDPIRRHVPHHSQMQLIRQIRKNCLLLRMNQHRVSHWLNHYYWKLQKPNPREKWTIIESNCWVHLYAWSPLTAIPNVNSREPPHTNDDISRAFSHWFDSVRMLKIDQTVSDVRIFRRTISCTSIWSINK